MNVTKAPIQREAQPAKPPAEPTPTPEPARARPFRVGGASLTSKATLLALSGLAGGLGLGLVRPAIDGSLGATLATVAGVGLMAILLTAVARSLLAGPIEALVAQCERAVRLGEQGALKSLPTGRADEVGRLARAFHSVAAAGHRDRQEAARLRRTLDDRIARATRRQVSHLEQIALRDALTLLGNRRCCDQRLPEQIAQSQAADQSLVCLMMDLDNFKQVNDTLGHAAGDTLLKVLGQLIRGSIRDDDLAVRLGGDELAVLMPGATAERAAQLADSLRHLLRQHLTTTMPTAPQVNLSAGVALLSELSEPEAANLLNLADQRLYQAKQAGKGCTTGPATADEPAATSATPRPRRAEQPVTAAPRNLQAANPAHREATDANAGAAPPKHPPYPTMGQSDTNDR
jgi:diguanylate cyclase (GGDEF)-like protein